MTNLSKSITGLKQSIVGSTIELYNKVQTSKQLLPTPAKSHYIYNLRDISKVFLGISRANAKSFKNQNDFIKLWAHQCSRVFKDRLISLQDQGFFDQLLKNLIKTNFKREWTQLVQIQPLLWSHFVPTIYPDGDTTKKPLNDIYCQLTNRDSLKNKCNQYLQQYNDFYTGNRMSLVLFMTAIQHVIKIVRIVNTPFGHALLVGVGGSGRKSLAMLSSYIAFQSQYSQIDSKNWVEQLQKLMKGVGLQQRSTVFLYSDTQILKQSMVQQVCNILNNGQVPNLFPTQQKAKIVQQITAIKPVGTYNQKYQYFVSLCKQYLHMVICMSPVGQSFRRRIRTFPALVNCTTIDWFLAWPQALRSTADNHFHSKMQIDNWQLRKGLVQISVDMQLRVTKLSKRYYDQLRRYYYVTPTSYLQLLGTLGRLLLSRSKTIDSQIKRYQNGVDKIIVTQKQVSQMQKQLQQLQPKLQKSTADNKVMLANLQVKQKDADAKKKVCQVQQKECNITRDQATQLRQSCQSDLDKVLPLLAAASQALDKITANDMNLLKSFVKPPISAAVVMQGLCYIFGQDSNVKVKADQDATTVFWDHAKKYLLKGDLIKRVKDFKEDQIKAIPQNKIAKLKIFGQKPQFQKQKVFNASKAAGNLSLWVRAVVDTYDALLVVQPKRIQLAQAQQKLYKAQKQLKEKKDALQEVLQLLAKLQADYAKAKKQKQDLQAQVLKVKTQLQRAQKLIKGLGSQKIAWSKKVEDWSDQKHGVIGDCVLCSGIIAYLGAFPSSYRQDTIQKWSELLNQLSINKSKKFDLQSALTDPLTIGVWTNTHKLPNDSFSIDNAIILKNSSRWPLMIDPQTQANNWVKQMQGSKLLIMRQTQNQKQLLMQIQNAVQLGLPVLLQNIPQTIQALFQPILQNKLIKSGGSFKLKFGDKLIDFSSDFRFYMTTKLGKPHYSPQICVKVTLLNFQVTLQGLQDQMLNIVVKIEQPIKQQQRQKNIREFFQNKNKQKATQDTILKMLNQAQGNLLDDDNLIQTLHNSKIQASQIQQKLLKQEYDRQLFNKIRNFYKEVAKRVANLYFVVLDLAGVQPTYQWSLEFYINLFQRSIDKALPGKDQRCKNIIDRFMHMLYQSICRSLLQKDKIIFSLTMTIRILLSQNKIASNQVRFMMVGGTWTQPDQTHPGNDWLNNKAWNTLCQLSKAIPIFQGLANSIKQNINQWFKIYDNSNPQQQTLPGKWKELNEFQKVLVMRIIRPDKFVRSAQLMISRQIGKQFVQPPPFNLQQAIADATALTPLIFILSPGADPRLQISSLAEKLGFKNNLNAISLGQGQGEIAKSSIKRAMQQGSWVLLQNCHLAPSFMPQLQKLNQAIDPTKVNKDFRIWLTSMPSNIFPVTILMKGIKMTYQPPRGLRNNLLRSFSVIDAAKFEDCAKIRQWKKLFFGLSFFHALILQRRKYGPLGWNIPYQFTAADFAISYSQLQLFLNQYQLIPYQALNYMVAQANYGGRVTDPHDRRLIKIILKQFYAPQVLADNFNIDKRGIYKILDDGPFSDFIDYIKSLPKNDSTDVFGLNPNAQISSAIIQTNSNCQTILSLLPRDVSMAGSSPQDIIKGKIKNILQKLPKPFDVAQASKIHPVLYQQSMNTVLQQQLIRFNKLLNTVLSSLVNVQKAIDGLVVMKSDLEMTFNNLFDNKVPLLWQKVSYPSLKPLGSYINDLIQRLNFMAKWIQNGAPPLFWISGFFFTQSFLTGTLQNFSRKYKIPIDTLSFKFNVIPQDTQIDLTKPASDGCYIYGLFLDGARWDSQLKCLNQSNPKQLYCKMPSIWLIPSPNLPEPDPNKCYVCPVYKTTARRGTLSTTGHSTNYVLSVHLPILQNSHSDIWVKQGLALVTALND